MDYTDIIIIFFTVIIILIIAALGTILVISWRNYKWMPVKGGRQLGLLTIYGVFGDGRGHRIRKGFFFDVTDKYIYRDGVIRQIRNEYNNIKAQIESLTTPDGAPIEGAEKAVQFLRLHLTAFYHARPLDDDVRVVIGRTWSGQIVFIIQYGYIEPLNRYSTSSGDQTSQFVLQMGAFFSPEIVTVRMFPISELITKHWARISDLPTQGAWYIVWPVDWSIEKIPEHPPPSEIVAEWIVGNQKSIRMMEQEPTRNRQLQEMQRRSKIEGSLLSFLQGKNAQMTAVLRAFNPEAANLGLDMAASSSLLPMLIAVIGTFMGGAAGLLLNNAIGVLITATIGDVIGAGIGMLLQRRGVLSG